MKNTLIQYEGGGYSGCLWEWNFFLWNKERKFEDIFSSGTAGIKTEEDAKKLLQSEKTVFIYNLLNEDDIVELNEENSKPVVLGLLTWFNKNHPEIDFFAICSNCGNRMYENSEVELVDWHGCGGIMSTADNLLCMDCYYSGVCDVCCDYVGEENIIQLSKIEKDSPLIEEKPLRWTVKGNFKHNDFVCIYCLDNEIQENKGKIQ